MAATLYGTLTAPRWGTQAEGELKIIVTGLSKTTDAEETLQTDETGDIVHAAYHGKNDEASCEFTVADDGYPASGLVAAAIVLNDTDIGGSYIVKTVENAKTNDGFMTGTMTLRWFPGFSTTTTTA
jgi:hypothetical protein